MGDSLGLYDPHDSDKTGRLWMTFILALELFLTLIVQYRQYSHITSVREVPQIVEEFGGDIYTSVDLDFSRQYMYDKLIHNVGAKLCTIGLWMVIMSSNGIFKLWKVAQSIGPLWPELKNPSIEQNMLFGLLLFIAHELVTFPSWAYEMKLKMKHGNFKLESPYSRLISLYLRQILANLVPVALTSALFTWIMKTLDQKTFYMRTVAIASFSYVYILLCPSFEIWYQIKEMEKAPRFYSSRLMNLCSVVGFPKKHLHLFRRASQTAHDSAFSFGFLWFQKIVVFHYPSPKLEPLSPHESDLILSNREIEAIVAHELGHWKFGHSMQDLLIWHAMHISTVLLAYLMRLSKPELLQNFGLPVSEGNKEIFLLPGMTLTYFILLRPYFYCFQFIHQWHQHFCEIQADKFATVTLPFRKDLGKALIKIALGSKSFPSEDPMFSFLYHSHQSLVTRLEQIAKYEQQYQQQQQQQQALRERRQFKTTF